MTTLKYGTAVAAIFCTWVLLKRIWIPWGEVEPLPWLDVIILNGSSIAALALGMRERKRQTGSLTFGQGVRAGALIATVYAAEMTLFFLIVYAVVGERMLAGEAAQHGTSIEAARIQAFAGIFFGSIVFGVLLSLVIAAFVRSRP